MSHTPMKKSVFERIERNGGNSSTSSSSTTNTSHKSTHGFCNTFIKVGSCPLGDSCKYIHEQPNLDKQGPKEELRITKTITRVIDMPSTSIKSTVTVSNEQRAVTSSNSTPSHRTVVESVPTSSDQKDRRLSSSDRKQSQSHSSDSKKKSSSNSNESSSKKKSHSSSKNKRSADSDSPFSSTSDSEYNHASHKRKKKSDTHSSSTKYKVPDLISPPDADEETLHDQLLRPTQTNVKSPKRTIVITERKKDENTKRTNKDTKSNPDIEFLGLKIINRNKKSIETIHQQAENNKTYTDIKRERKSPSKSSSDQSKRHSTVTVTNNTMYNDRSMQIKLEDGKHQSNKTQNSSEQSSDRSTKQSTPPIVVQLSPSPSITGTLELNEKGPTTCSNEPEKIVSVQPPSPVCVILDDDSSPSSPIEKKVTRQSPPTTVKRTHESDKYSSKQTKRSRDSDKSHSKEKTNENTDVKRKRPNDDNSRKTSSSRKIENESRSASNRSDSRRNANISSRDESSSRKYKEKSESKTSKTNDSKDRNMLPSSSSKTRSTNARRDVGRSSPEKKRSTHRRGKEKGLENVTDSEEHIEELIPPKQAILEAYMSMDWSSLSRDKRIPLNTQITSRVARLDNNINVLGVSERFLTKEQKEKLNDNEFQSSPLIHFMKQLQNKSSTQIINSCHRRFGSCAKDMIEMRHRWFLRSVEPVQQYEFINKEHYIAYQQAINSLLDKTSTDTPTVQIETTTTTTTTVDVLLS